MIEDIKKELEEALITLQKVIADPALLNKIAEAAQIMASSLKNGGKIISCGNGGSHCDAMHFAEELSGRYRDNRPAMAAIAISDPSHISCVGNDYGFDFIFSRYVEGLGNKGDVLLGISTSGNSKNVIEAAKAARSKGMKVIILSGNTGGVLADEADLEIRVPHQGYADRIQEIHIKIIHILIQQIEKKMAVND
ncbi:D-sedoheptulose 7-phosphate isomerase [Marinigracilibium pacificum]|uniref:Phosphoheptose isomerase n=1 Tax=Marinigracilibium pacificum TaxID=2729599 RepID=A0A848J0N4_9BACT|nr:D-sedoheptulose 7-phosphate isomerase [Marinigracilibium pacificum]